MRDVMRKLISMFCIFAVVMSGCAAKTEQKEEKKPVEKPVVQEEKEVSLCFSGDILMEDGIYSWMSDGYTKDAYDFKNYFDQVKPFFDKDLVIGNQEVPIGGRALGLTGINYQFNAPEELAPQLANLGFDVLTFANNHSYDRGIAGIEATIHHLEKEGIATTGASTNPEGSQPLIIEKKGVSFAILAYTYDTNQPIESANAYSVNKFLNQNHEFDEEQKQKIKQEVEAAQKAADVTIVSMHWGTEFTYTLSAVQLEAAQFLNELGVDIIIGNHPHTLQGVDTLVNKQGKETFVMYSLGNFISSAAAVSRASEQFANMYEVGGIVTCKVIFDPETKKVELRDKKMNPIVNHFTYGYDNFQLIPFSEYTEELAQQHYQRYMSYNFTKEYLNANLSALFDGAIDWN